MHTKPDKKVYVQPDSDKENTPMASHERSKIIKAVHSYGYRGDLDWTPLSVKPIYEDWYGGWTVCCRRSIDGMIELVINGRNWKEVIKNLDHEMFLMVDAKEQGA